MLSDILKGAKPLVVANQNQEQEVAQETLGEKASGETGFWSGLKKGITDFGNTAMALISQPDPATYLQDKPNIPQRIVGLNSWSAVAQNFRGGIGLIPYGVGNFMKSFFKEAPEVSSAGLKNLSGDDLSYIKSLDRNDAFKYLNSRGLVVDATKTQRALDSYYGALQTNIKRYGLDKQEPPKSIFSPKEENLLKLTKQKAFDTATGFGLTQTASARTVQLMEDGFRATITGPKMSLNDIEDKYNKLKAEGGLTPQAEEIYKKSKEVYEKALPRISEIAVMQSKHVGKNNETTEDLVMKELREKGFKSVNDYIYQDTKEEDGYQNKSLADYMKSQSASIDLIYQFKKKDGLDYSSLLPYKDLNEKFHAIGAVTAIAGTQLNAWAQQLFSATNAMGAGYLFPVTGAKYGVGDLKLGTYAYTEEGSGAYARRLAKGADFLPEAASLVVGTKGLDKLLRVGRMGRFLGGTSMEGGLAYKMLSALKLSPQRALQGERAIQNVAYTALNTVPREMIVGTIGNTRDPKSGSQDQEYRAMFDAGIGASMGAWRQFKDISRINAIFQTPEDGKAFLDTLKMQGPNLSQEELEFFSRFHPTVMKTFEQAHNATIAKGVADGDELILGMKPQEWTDNAKKAYANAKVRDLYIKSAGQLTDADRNLLANMQKLVTDENINLADIVKLDWNIPGKFSFAGQTSNIKTRVDQFQAALDWEYQQTVDDVFDWQGWTPDSVFNKEQLDRVESNIQTKGLFRDLDGGVDIINKDGVSEFRPYIQEVDDGYTLTREGYEYLGIVDKRTAVDDIVRSDAGIEVGEALRIAQENGAQISDETISLIENTDLIDQLISISGC